MTNLELISLLRESTFINEDGGNYQLKFQPALTHSELEKCAKQFPSGKIDPEVLEILEFTRGWDGYLPENVYFDSIDEFGFTELLPHSISLGEDGLGNFWVLDLDSEGNTGKVFYACHDPAVLVVHSQNINEYLAHLVESNQNPTANYLNRVYSQVVYNVWKDDFYTSSKSAFLEANPVYQEFLSQFNGEDWSVADLRAGHNEMGFAWGKQGSNSLTQRHPTDMIWVMKNRRKGFLNKLLGI